MKTLRTAVALLVAALAFSVVPTFAQAKTPADTSKTPAKKTITPAASDADIAAAKAAGKVWVNKNSDSKAYHKADSKFYGKTKKGEFMMEADAQKAGYHLAKNEDASAKPAKKAAPKK